MMWGAATMGWIVMSLILVGFWALVVFGIAAVFRFPHAAPPPRRVRRRPIRCRSSTARLAAGSTPRSTGPRGRAWRSPR
ncbi:exported hypothetical protein [Rhodococcus ruber]|uniref:Uncharacterized protein n=1 Tax=Rhodococcus ruber TaxID=1830 RepID=A0A098BR32_9NOCA|nr:exported hypothetical protein [Rhodococcus ruber]